MDLISQPNSQEKRIFLTSLMRQQTETEIPQSEIVNSLFNQLNSCIEELDSKVGNILQKHEADFLNVYKGHMYNIQKEMRELKEKVSEEEVKRKRDEELKCLEKERDWFRNEALRLDKICKEYKRNLEIWKSKAQILEEDRSFMENQILIIKKQNLKLKEGIDSQRELNYSLEKSWLKADESKELINKAAEGSYRYGGEEKLIEKYKNTIKHLQSQLEQQKKAMKMQKSVSASYFLEKGTLEDFFLHCIEEVQKDIRNRKNKSLPLKGLRSASSAQILDRSSSGDVRLKDFTLTDKKKLVELMVCKEEVLRLLKDLIFPKNLEKKKRPGTGTGKNFGLSYVFSTPLISDTQNFARPSTAPKPLVKT